MLRNRRFRVIASLLAATAIAACASSEEVDDSDSNQEAAPDPLAHLYTGMWTNWYRHKFDLENKVKPEAQGLVNLLTMRTALTAKHLFDRQVKKDVSCEGTQDHRTVDGTCNDVEFDGAGKPTGGRPWAGAANARFGRNTDPGPEGAKLTSEADLLHPNPLVISRKLLTRDLTPGETAKDRKPIVKEVGFLNLLAAAWIQYQTHDWFAHPQQKDTTISFTDKDAGRTIKIPLSKPVADDKHIFENSVTHWWDASQIYGSDQRTFDRIRDGASGNIKLEGGLLPIVGGQEDTGFTTNWWVGLSLLHTLFANEHNAIAAKIREKHSDFSEEKIYNIARLVNAAVMAKIHTVEWTPAILPNPQLAKAMDMNWNGAELPVPVKPKTADAQEGSTAEKAAEAEAPKVEIKKIPPILGSGSPDRERRDPSLTVVPYSLTEEFTSVYRLHSLLPEELVLQSHVNPSKSAPPKPLTETRAGRLSIPGWSMPELFYSFGRQHPGQITLHNYPRFLQHIDVNVLGVNFKTIDMGATDIVRDRERVPRYNEFRRKLRLKPIQKFEDLFLTPVGTEKAGDPVAAGIPTTNPAAKTEKEIQDGQAEAARFIKELKEVYGEGPDGVEQLDLLVGCLAESVRPNGFGFGETQFQVFILMASRRLQADRFFTSDFREEIYTAEGIQWIKDATMKTVILRHYKDLAPALEGVKDGNAFNPWTAVR
jgi:hypothetical protein